VIRGSIEDHDILRKAASETDGTIHLAFNHDFARIREYCQTVHLPAIQAIGEELRGTDKVLACASGTSVVNGDRIATEDLAGDPDSAGAHRIPSEEYLGSLAEDGVRTIVMRFASIVHGEGDQLLVPAMLRYAREAETSGYVGDGANQWTAVHRLDLARLVRLAVEKAPAGSRVHGVAETVTFRDLATKIGDALGVPVVGMSMEELAALTAPWMAGFVAHNNPASSAATQRLLGWTPQELDLFDDLAKHYLPTARS
jgi:nucleoside-diphosphate-sugar epimerase